MNRKQRRELAKKNKKAANKKAVTPVAVTSDSSNSECWLDFPSDPFIIGLQKIGRYNDCSNLINTNIFNDTLASWSSIELPMFHPREWTHMSKFLDTDGNKFLSEMKGWVSYLRDIDINGAEIDGSRDMMWSLILDMSNGEASLIDHVASKEYPINPAWFLNMLDPNRL